MSVAPVEGTAGEAAEAAILGEPVSIAGGGRGTKGAAEAAWLASHAAVIRGAVDGARLVALCLVGRSGEVKAARLIARFLAGGGDVAVSSQSSPARLRFPEAGVGDGVADGVGDGAAEEKVRREVAGVGDGAAEEKVGQKAAGVRGGAEKVRREAARVARFVRREGETGGLGAPGMTRISRVIARFLDGRETAVVGESSSTAAHVRLLPPDAAVSPKIFLSFWRRQPRPEASVST